MKNALLQVDGRADDLADDGAGCAAGEERVFTWLVRLALLLV